MSDVLTPEEWNEQASRWRNRSAWRHRDVRGAEEALALHDRALRELLAAAKSGRDNEHTMREVTHDEMLSERARAEAAESRVEALTQALRDALDLIDSQGTPAASSGTEHEG